MNKTYIILFSALLVALLSGCESALKEINAKSLSTRSDVFIEIENDEAIRSGYANVIIKVSIRTPLTGYYLWESSDSFSGKPGFPFVFNVDGQAVVWKIDGHEEITSPYDEKGDRTPDGGKGIRYILNKKIRLVTGSHKLFLGVPEDEYGREFVIFVKHGVSTLEFEPVYSGDHQRTAPSFLNGIHAFELFYDRSPIK